MRSVNSAEPYLPVSLLYVLGGQSAQLPPVDVEEQPMRYSPACPSGCELQMTLSMRVLWMIFQLPYAESTITLWSRREDASKVLDIQHTGHPLQLLHAPEPVVRRRQATMSGEVVLTFVSNASDGSHLRRLCT
jgi:hypothetical protein